MINNIGMITKLRNAQPREFKGISFDVLSIGKNSMVTKMNYKQGDYGSVHSHPNEQSGYVISGKYKITIDGEEDIIIPGDSYVILENIPHSIEVVESGEIIDVFTPIRTDYL